MDNIQITKKTKLATKPSERVKLIAAVKTLKKGQCIEYRGNLETPQVRAVAGNASIWLPHKYSAHVVEGGIDIFCE